MKKWIKQTIKYILLAMFVAGMLYFNIKDHAAEIFDTLQHLQLRYTLGLHRLPINAHFIVFSALFLLVSGEQTNALNMAR